ncbi:PREDICTED: uncharacterized protein LOC18596430 isoform X3 [Theobroma cacao]|nr:PREDICTED: uncharacterized protein LOC18596430 isoform X3 [Theobroma cacao]XP_017979246.1 PREDICTED: uncharacterized protein LOC18596430 isoform X3 [Theobroma cacao]
MDDAEQNSVFGSCPEFGAIFISNNSTKKECLRRKIFALPSSQYHFVKQVKAGMILFLFEFERRELHGVFQACSDGAMNILPHAFSSSGKEFPAQVKVNPMWNCLPLSENEFRDAIRENYFSRYKFNFGLSEDQVRRLLLLFSFKRLKDQAPQRQLPRSKVAARPSVYSTRKLRRVVDNDRSLMRNQVLGECDVDNNHRPVISTKHHGDSFYNDDRATDDGGFGTYMDVGDKHKASAFLNECFQDHMGKVGGNIDAGECTTNDGLEIERNTGIELQPEVSVGYSLCNFRSFSNDVRFAKSDRLETECYKDDGFASTISTTYPSSFQSKVNPHACPSKHVLEADSYVHDPTRPSSTFRPSMELQNPNVSYPRTYEDSIVTTALPYDPDVPSINYQGPSSLGFNQGPSSLGFNQGHASFQEYSSHDSFVANVFGFSKNQLFPSLLETNTTITVDVNSGSMDFIPLPYSNQYEHSSRTSLPRHAYSDDIAAEYSKNECSDDVSFLKPSLAPIPSSEIRNNVRMSTQPSSYGTSLIKFPSLMFSSRYPTLLQARHDCQVPECENNAGFGNDVSMFKEYRHHGDSFYNENKAIEDGTFATYNYVECEHKEGQYPLHVHEPANIDYHEVSSLNPAAYQNSECLYPDHRKKRGSVFSRLALPPKVCEQESNTSPGTADINRSTSVNEVMDMLHRSHKHWRKTRTKQLVQQHDNAASFRDKKQAAKKESLAMISKEMNLKPAPFSKENSSQKTEETTFVDFRRRRVVRKNLEDGKTGNHCESLENKSASASQSKRRKLIRPNFCENESFERGISGDSPENLIPSSVGCSVSKNAVSIKASVCHENEDDISQNVKLPNAMCQTAVEGNIDKGSDSNSEQFSMESLIALRSADEDGKESSQNHGISSMTSVSCGDMRKEIEQDLSNRDLGMDGLFQERNNVSHSNHESSPKICEDNDGSGVAKSELLHNIEQINHI